MLCLIEVVTAQASPPPFPRRFPLCLPRYDALQALVAPASPIAPCYWSFYMIPSKERTWYSVPMCTHDPKKDMISG